MSGTGESGCCEGGRERVVVVRGEERGESGCCEGGGERREWLV